MHVLYTVQLLQLQFLRVVKKLTTWPLATPKPTHSEDCPTVLASSSGDTDEERLPLILALFRDIAVNQFPRQL